MRRARAAAGALAFCFVWAAASHGAVEPRAQSSVATEALGLVTLAERIAKLHAQIGQGLLVERSRRDLAQALRQFDAGLRAVSAQATSPEARDTYVLLAALWREHRDWVARPPSREGARQMRERTEELAWIAQKGARMVQGDARATVNAGAFRAAQAGLLAQRIAKACLWRRWGMRDERLEKERRESDENLDRLLAALRSGRGNTPEIEGELQTAETQLRFLRESARELDAGRSAPRAIEFVAKSADHILESMARVARLYEEGAPGAGS